MWQVLETAPIRLDQQLGGAEGSEASLATVEIPTVGTKMRPFAGWCIFDRVTGEHVSHITPLPGDLDMPGYAETIERSYEGSPWIPVRRYCAEFEVEKNGT